MAEQFINAPAPSRKEFQTLSDHIERFVLVTNTYNITNGYVTVTNANIKLTSLIFVQIVRSDNTWERVLAYPRIDSAGAVNIYLRMSNSATDVTGSIKLNILIYTP